MRIRAAVTESTGAPLAIEELELDQPRPDEIVVRIAAERASRCSGSHRRADGGDGRPGRGRHHDHRDHPRPARLQVARELGATHVIDPSQVDPVEISEVTGGVGADFAIDAAGLPQYVQQAVYGTGPGGVCCLIGAPPFGTEVSLDMNQVLAVGRTVRGIVEGESVPDVFLLTLIELWRQGRFRVRPDHDLLRLRRDRRGRPGRGGGRVIKPVLRMGAGA